MKRERKRSPCDAPIPIFRHEGLTLSMAMYPRRVEFLWRDCLHTITPTGFSPLLGLVEESSDMWEGVVCCACSGNAYRHTSERVDTGKGLRGFWSGSSDFRYTENDE